jgi:DNA-binding GntR family transcriptional regulator
MSERKNLTLAVYDSIKEMMLNYDIVPGQRLVFVDLAKQLGVSRTPVNNALSILAKEGYLDFVPNQGYSVHKLTLEEAESLYEIREILEIGTIAKAIRQMSPDKLEMLEKKRLEYENSISDRVHRKLFILDAEFHAAIIGMIDNLYLVDRYRDLCQRIFLRFRTEDLRMDRQKEIVKEHKSLCEAVQNKDVDWAKDLIRNHHANSKKNLFAIIFSEDSKRATKRVIAMRQTGT